MQEYARRLELYLHPIFVLLLPNSYAKGVRLFDTQYQSKKLIFAFSGLYFQVSTV